MSGSKIVGFLVILGIGIALIVTSINTLSNKNTVTCDGQTMSEGDTCMSTSYGSTATSGYTQQQQNNQSGASFSLGFGVLFVLGSFFILRKDKSPVSHRPPLSQNNQSRNSAPAGNASIVSPLLSEYKALCSQLAQTGVTGPFTGALVVGGSDQKIGQMIYLQLESAWLTKKQTDIFSAPVEAYPLSGKTITAAVFKQISANTYMMWDMQHQPLKVTVLSSKVILTNFGKWPSAAPQALTSQPQLVSQGAGSSPMAPPPVSGFQSSVSSPQISALEVLGQRYARGEIDTTTYLQMRAVLENRPN